MYTRSQRFLATLLLFSMLLQSCHNANFKLHCEETPKVLYSQQGANTLPATPAQQTLVPIRAVAIEKVSGDLTESAHTTPVASPTIIASPHAQDVDSAIGTPASSLTTSVQHAYTSGPSPRAQEAAQYSAHKSGHGVLDNALLVRHTHRKGTQVTAVSVPVWSSTHTTQPVLPPQGAENPLQTEEKSSTRDAVHQGSPRAVLSSSSAQPYLSAQRHQVRFEEQAGGAWLAQVQDVWGLVQRLPVICAPGQTTEQAIRLLADKDPAQYKYWVHVLETDQLPWASRFVYVGALGIIGGGNSSSSDRGSSDRSNRESRRDRDDFFDGNRGRAHLGSIAIGPQGMEARFGPRNDHANAIAASNAVNEGIRRGNETWRSRTNISTPGLGLDTSAFTRSSIETPAFPRSSSSTSTFPRSGLNTSTFPRSSTVDATNRTSSLSSQSSSDVPRWMVDDLNRGLANSRSASQFSGSASTPFGTSGTCQRSTDTGTRFANRNTDGRDYSETDHQKKTQSQGAGNRPRQEEQQHQRKNPDENEAATQLVKEFERGLAVVFSNIRREIGRVLAEERREKETARRETTEEKLPEKSKNLEHTIKESFCRQEEVSSTTTGPDAQQQRSGAVVSQGFVLDGEGKLKPHEVRVPFAAPRAYQASPSAKAATAVQDTRSADAVEKTTETQTALRRSVAAYQQSYEADAEFQQQRSTLSKLGERLKSEASNEGLARQYQEQEAKFRQHPLYQQGCDLAKEAQKLRAAESKKADHIIPSKAEMDLGVGRAKLKQSERHRQVAAGIRDDLLQPVREILKRPSTPPSIQTAGQFAKGVGESAVGTAKEVVNLPVVAAKFLGGAVHSLGTWEDKLGIGEKITDASELVKAFCEEVKYEWENSKEHQSRLQAAQQCRKELDIAEKALNAEVYHNRDARELGCWSGEALQAVFGAEIIKGGAGLVKGAQKAAKASKKAAQGAEATKSVGKAAESIEKGAARATQAGKEVQVAQQAESVGGVVEQVEVDAIIKGSSKNVQEAYSSAKAWLGADCRAITNPSGDMVFMSKDGLRKFRFDIKNPNRDLPHVHLEVLHNGKWRDAAKGNHRIYPKPD
jgi:hypothetical protein